MLNQPYLGVNYSWLIRKRKKKQKTSPGAIVLIIAPLRQKGMCAYFACSLSWQPMLVVTSPNTIHHVEMRRFEQRHSTFSFSFCQPALSFARVIILPPLFLGLWALTFPYRVRSAGTPASSHIPKICLSDSLSVSVKGLFVYMCPTLVLFGVAHRQTAKNGLFGITFHRN